jgi:hypothetical protein
MNNSMKRKLLLLFQPFCICVLVACALEDKHEWQYRVAGTYAAQYEQTYSVGLDTLFITSRKAASASFHVLRHTTYQRKPTIATTNGKINRVEDWIALPDQSQPLLHVVPSGRKLWFDVAGDQLITGTLTYHRIK